MECYTTGAVPHNDFPRSAVILDNFPRRCRSTPFPVKSMQWPQAKISWPALLKSPSGRPGTLQGNTTGGVKGAAEQVQAQLTSRKPPLSAPYTDLRCLAAKTSQLLPQEAWEIDNFKSFWQEPQTSCMWPFVPFTEVGHLCSVRSC
jgi:hypothetical protein